MIFWGTPMTSETSTFVASRTESLRAMSTDTYPESKVHHDSTYPMNAIKGFEKNIRKICGNAAKLGKNIKIRWLMHDD